MQLKKRRIIRLIICIILFLALMVLHPEVQQLIGIGINHPIQNKVYFILVLLMVLTGGWTVWSRAWSGIMHFAFVPEHLQALALAGLVLYGFLVLFSYTLHPFYLETGIIILVFAYFHLRRGI